MVFDNCLLYETYKMKGQMKVYYDEEADFLEISVGKPSKSYAEEVEPGAFVRYDEETGEAKSIGIINFKKRVVEYLRILEEEPLITQKPGKLKNVHMGVILKQVSLIYRVKPIAKQIELISFIDNRQDPKRIKKYKPLP